MNKPFESKEEFDKFYEDKLASGRWISNMMKKLTEWWGNDYLIYQWAVKDSKVHIHYKTRSECYFIDNGRFAFPVECFWGEDWEDIYKKAEEEEKKKEEKERKAEAKKAKKMEKEKEMEHLARLIDKFPKEAADLIESA